MKNDKRKGGEYSQYPPPENKLGKSQPSKRLYCYFLWTFLSRRFLSRRRNSPGLVLPTARGAMGGSGGMGLWGRFLTGLPELFCCGGIGVAIVD
jgi:hypothetical protein